MDCGLVEQNEPFAERPGLARDLAPFGFRQGVERLPCIRENRRWHRSRRLCRM
jgi:hypothetical protein